jgi:hypothetical protein
MDRETSRLLLWGGCEWRLLLVGLLLVRLRSVCLLRILLGRSALMWLALMCWPDVLNTVAVPAGSRA